MKPGMDQDALVPVRTAEATGWMAELGVSCYDRGHRSGFRCIPLKTQIHVGAVKHTCAEWVPDARARR